MLGWLHATPVPPKESKRVPSKLSRLERMQRDRIDPEMPPNPAPHITGWLVDMGIVEARGMGNAVLSWGEIDAWCRRTRVDLEPWVARLIRHLSAAYIAEGRRAESETCPAPWRTQVSQRERDADEARLSMVLG